MNTSTRAFALSALLFAAQIGEADAQGKEKAQSANSDTLADYAYRMDLAVSGAQGVVGLRLPQAVYLHSRAANLDDLRIFDANGAKVAFALHVPVAPPEERHRSSPVKIFPVMASATQAPQDAPAERIELDIRTSADGSLLSVKTKSAGDGQAGRLQSLVLDAAHGPDASQGKPITALRFKPPAGATNYSAQVWLEVSDDLKQWDAIGTAELSWLANAEAQTLANDRLEFAPRRFRYARLSWRKGEPLAFAAISAETVEQTSAAPALEKLSIQPETGKEARDLVYRGALAIPVEKIGLQFTEQNIVFPAAIGDYQEIPGRQIGQPTTWRFQARAQATFYQITQDGKTRASGEIALPITHNAQWVIRPSGPGAAKPVFTIAWQAASLIFVTSGKSPYTLAFGRENVNTAARDLSEVAPGFGVSELQKLEQARLGDLQQQAVAAGQSASEASKAGRAAQERTLVLWSVLILGVLVLGAMVWNLMKQMKETKQ